MHQTTRAHKKTGQEQRHAHLRGARVIAPQTQTFRVQARAEPKERWPPPQGQRPIGKNRRALGSARPNIVGPRAVSWLLRRDPRPGEKFREAPKPANSSRRFSGAPVQSFPRTPYLAHL